MPPAGNCVVVRGSWEQHSTNMRSPRVSASRAGASRGRAMDSTSSRFHGQRASTRALSYTIAFVIRGLKYGRQKDPNPSKIRRTAFE